VKYHKDEPSQPLRSDYAPLSYQVDGAPLAVHPDDFIQVNGAINALMVQQAMAWLQPQAGESIADFFAGHGNFSMALARRGAQVLALEGQASMVTRLQQQAEQQGLYVRALSADLSKASALTALPAMSAVLLDPPRAGAEAVVEHLLDEAVDRILYVACDAATLTRDLRRLTQGNYQVVKAGIMDMFPQTHHVETMVLLTRVGK
jgi:23S rRNA (uracil1939-C5)-methyltransferase